MLFIASILYQYRWLISSIVVFLIIASIFTGLWIGGVFSTQSPTPTTDTQTDTQTETDEEAKRKAAEEEAKRKAAEEEAKKTTTAAVTTTTTAAVTTTTTPGPTTTPGATTTPGPTTTTTAAPTTTTTAAPTTRIATAWNCITKDGIDWAPVRIGTTGETECASDGTNCLWKKTKSECNNFDVNATPIKCGEDHKKRFGGDGYSTTGHWCGKKEETPQSFEVYHISGYDYNKDQAESECAKYGGTLATYSQLEQAQKNGGDWCSTGWLKDRTTKHYPISWNTVPGCGNGSTGIKEWNNDPNAGKAGANCWGKKPAKGTSKILAFSDETWNQDNYGIEFYADSQYQGDRLVLNVGRWNLHQFGFGDKVSSFKIPKGLKLIVHQHDDFNGAKREFLNNVPWIGDIDIFWNDQISSVEVLKI